MSHDSPTSNPAFYAGYHALRLRHHPHGILEIVMSGEGANRSGLATADARMHRELADIWRDIVTTNADEIGPALDALMSELRRLRAGPGFRG